MKLRMIPFPNRSSQSRVPRPIICQNFTGDFASVCHHPDGGILPRPLQDNPGALI
jgi:hypothetical protein